MKYVALVMLLAACGNSKLNIGINAGPAGADVARMASSEVRQSRAAKGKRVDVRVAAMKPMVAGSATPQMLATSLDSMIDDEKIPVVISRFLDKETVDEAHRFISKGMPFLATTPVPDGILSAKGPGFGLVPGYGKQAAFLAAQAKSDDKVAVVYLDDLYGNTMLQALTDALKARGLTVAAARKYEQSWDEPRMVALGTDLQTTTNPTLVYFLGRAPSLELVWQPFRDNNKSIRVLGSDLIESPAIYDNPDGRFTGLRYVRFFDTKSKEARMKDLHDRYAVWIGRGEMTGEMVMIYDAMLMTGEALRSGARTRAEIQQYFASLGRTRPPFNGVGGLISFGDDGTVDRKFILAEVTDRGIIVADSVQN
jgi:ABC-type branched-subunit amino acid transport system substrate-binding protein